MPTLKQLVGLASLALATLGILLHIAATATSAWNVLVVNKKDPNDPTGANNIIMLGPWRSCDYSAKLDAWKCVLPQWLEGEDEGEDPEHAPEHWGAAVQAMTVLGALAAAVGRDFGLMAVIQDFEEKITLILASSISALAAFFMFLGILIWSTNGDIPDNPLVEKGFAYSFYLSCVGALMTGGAAMGYVVVGFLMRG